MNLDDYDEALVSAVAKIEIERDELLLALERVLPFLTGNYWPGLAADPAVDFAIAAAKKSRGRKAATMTPNVEVQGQDEAQLRTVPLKRPVGRKEE